MVEIDEKTGVAMSLINQLYNAKVKKLFLEEYLKDSKVRETYCVNLILTSTWESIIKKDLYEFSEDDIKNMFANCYTSSPTSMRTLFSIGKQYLNWATDIKLLNRTGENPFNILNFKKDILPMLNTKKLYNKFLSEEQIWEIANEAKNAQDSMPLVCSFYGLKGDRNVELKYLKREDIDTVNNKVTVVSKVKIDKDGNEIGIIEKREITNLPQKVIDLILMADGEDIYYKTGDEDAMSTKFTKLVDSEYVLRPSIIGKRDSSDQVKSQTIATRVKKLLINAGYENLSINDIVTSGKLEVLKKIEKETGKLEIDDYRLVNMIFNENPNNYSNIKTLYEMAISKAD